MILSGFSKLSKDKKIDLLLNHCFGNETQEKKKLLESFWHQDETKQKQFDEFSENTLTNFYCPYGVVPDFKMNGKNYWVPMVIEESSVVAAACRSAKYWSTRGGFHAEVVDVKKTGQVHFTWEGESQVLKDYFKTVKKDLLEYLKPLTMNMEKRGGGLLDLELIDKTADEPHYYQLMVTFNTCDAMGANFINTVLEALAKKWEETVGAEESFTKESREILTIMSILSNYTPECLVRAWVECDIEELADPKIEMGPELFAKKIDMAVKVATIDVYRATTHNKGIFNGIDAVVLATGNDFRAVEACAHAYAARDGQYKSLSKVDFDGKKFRFSLEIPLSLGTVGGLTRLHPMAKMSLELLGNPSAAELMMITASVGLAQNFAALRSLVTSGIQKGHMKMHLLNILNHFEASDQEKEMALEYFKTVTVSFKAVQDFLREKRDYQ